MSCHLIYTHTYTHIYLYRCKLDNMYELLQNSYKVILWDFLLKYVDVHIKCMILYDSIFLQS